MAPLGLVGWLRVARATVEGSGVSVLPDLMNADGGAIQTDDTRRPALQVLGNGLPIMHFVDDFLLHPLRAKVNGNANFFSMGLWLRTPLATLSRMIYAMGPAPGASSAKRISVFQITSSEGVLTDVAIDNANARRSITGNSAIGDNTWQFVTCEFEGAKAGDARLIVTSNNAESSLTFSAVGTAAEVPATLQIATGHGLIGASNTSATLALTGDIGPNIFFWNKQLTAPVRATFMAFDDPR